MTLLLPLLPLPKLKLRFGLGFALGRFSGDVGASYESALASPLAVSGVNVRCCRWCRDSSYASALASPLAVSWVTLRLLPLLPLLPPPKLELRFGLGFAFGHFWSGHPLLPLLSQIWLRFGLGFAFGRCLGDVAVVAVGVDVE